ncbi:MAG TPA: DUF4149 domain-containing protein [Blastocatellia bacterium]|nr:DUF4149 domain-containing protein [Blastocatellia bacterium]
MYALNVWIHLVMAAVWVGGLIYTAAVVVPYAVSHGPEERQRILRGLARRFRRIGWGSLILLILTGLGNLALGRPDASIWEIITGAGSTSFWLRWKLALIAVMIALMAFHDITSIRAAQRYEGNRESAPGNRAGSMAAALATLIAIAILYVSVRLVRG